MVEERRTDVVTSRVASFTFRRFRVAVVGGDPPSEATSDGSELTIGTAEGNQLVLSDPTVSRHHCAIRVSPRGFQLVDLGSTNGTWLAGFRIDAAYLKPGATFRVGSMTVRFDCLDDEIREELSADDRFGDALGQSPAMRRIFALAAKVAGADITVLLEGETGTGKGLLADLIHRQSRRANGPFVVVDCGAIPPTLIESELFGHEKGAFTGAHVARVGAFEAAQSGTVFLDEIGELPLDLQTKLLRALEERTIKRVGSTRPVRLDVRVLAATNRDLREAVNAGRFRADLYYRLAVVRMRIPPLRDRREDIPLLVSHYYRIFTGDDAAVAPPSLVTQLAAQGWPGNVRELRSAVERAVLMAEPVWPDPDESDTPLPSATPAFDERLSFREAKERAVAAWERRYLNELVERHAGNLSRAARAARMDRAHLRELLRRYGDRDSRES
ncbi:MAG TPA: sigma 54-interacting transcriptional regulator [Kofleriaceae bacterium]|nr:sigma 54-interacting transcriptional regulator [Kofleriaceae bacterium]